MTTKQPTSSPIGRLLSTTTALLGSALAFVVTGALVAHLLGDWGGASVVAYVVAVLACFIVPIAVGIRIAGDEPKGSVVTGAVASFDVLLLALLVGIAPTASRAALYAHGDWFLLGTDVPFVRDAARAVSAYIPRSEPPAPIEVVTTSSEPVAADAGVADSARDLPALPAIAAVPPPSEDPFPWSAQVLFGNRADAVVTIRIRRPIDPDDPMADFYERDGLDSIEASGSGFIVGDTGVIVTNHHVIGLAASARVVLRDGRTFDSVQVLGSDPANDLGLLTIDATDLPTAPLAPDGEPAVGANVFAIGSPLGLEQTLTQGIVSAIRVEGGTTVVQTQAPIAPGSSGGPLFDDHGRVVGVTTFTRSSGLNFAVRADHVRALVDGPHVARALLHYVAGPHATSVEVEGPPMHPWLRTSLEPMGLAVARAATRCITEWPAVAPTITFDVTGRVAAADAGLRTNQGELVDRCLRAHDVALSSVLEHHLRRDIRETTTITIHIAGLGATEGDPGHEVVVILRR